MADRIAASPHPSGSQHGSEHTRSLSSSKAKSAFSQDAAAHTHHSSDSAESVVQGDNQSTSSHDAQQYSDRQTHDSRSSSINQEQGQNRRASEINTESEGDRESEDGDTDRGKQWSRSESPAAGSGVAPSGQSHASSRQDRSARSQQTRSSSASTSRHSIRSVSNGSDIRVRQQQVADQASSKASFPASARPPRPYLGPPPPPGASTFQLPAGASICPPPPQPPDSEPVKAPNWLARGKTGAKEFARRFNSVEAVLTEIEKKCLFRHLMTFPIVAAILFISLLVAGCSHSSFRSVYVVSLSYRQSLNQGDHNTTSAITNPSLYTTFDDVLSSASPDLVVRVGYFGICIDLGSSHKWTCKANAAKLANLVDADQDPLNLIAVGSDLRSRSLLSILPIISAVLLMTATFVLYKFPGWHQEKYDDDGSTRDVKPFPAAHKTHAVAGLCIAAFLLVLLASLWQHVSAVSYGSAVAIAFGQRVRSQLGTAAIGLCWGATAAAACAAAGIMMLIASLRMLSESLDD